MTANLGTEQEATTPYLYDFEGHLAAIGAAGGAGSRSYSYDAEGNRLSSTVNVSSGTSIVPQTTSYLNDVNLAHAPVLEEYANGVRQASYDWMATAWRQPPHRTLKRQ